MLEKPQINQGIAQRPSETKNVTCSEKEDFIKPETMQEFARAFELLDIPLPVLPQVNVKFVESGGVGKLVVEDGKISMLYNRAFMDEANINEGPLAQALKKFGFPGVQ